MRSIPPKNSLARQTGFGLLGLVLLSGCSLNTLPTDHPDHVRATVDHQLGQQALQARQPVYPARESATRLPRDALWLGQTRTVHFTDPVPARPLVRALLDTHPVRFALNDHDNPLIQPADASLILKDYLDSVSVQANWHYEVVDGVVVFSDWQVTTLPIASLMGQLAGALSSTTGVAESDSFNRLAVDTDPYAEVERLVENILAASAVDSTSEAASDAVQRKATFSVSRAANQLMVSARPNQIRALGKALQAFNASVSRRVIFHVLLYDVALNDGEERSLDLQALVDLTRLSARLRGALPNTALIGDSLSIVNLETTGVRRSPLDLQGLLLSWIQTRGTVAHRMQRRFEALNNRPVTFLDTTEIEYVKGTEVTTPEGGGPATITETLATHQVGRAFSLHATIVDERVNVQMTINQRTARPKPRGENGVHLLYDIDNVDRVIPLSLRDGETRVLTHFSSHDRRIEQSRNRLLPWIGDGNTQRQALLETVIAISAEIVE